MPDNRELPLPKIVDLFAGPGGWDEALAGLGRTDVIGIEYDEPCCRTREAAGHATRHANVAELDPLDYAGIEGLIASPPCQAWSMAGSRGAVQDQPLVYHVMEQLMQGRDVRSKAREDAVDERSLLVAEPLRWALALKPRWIACEQVEPVADLWAWTAEQLRAIGYSAWSGVLSAERYGVPQTRRRAFLIASLDRVATAPAPTHQAYRAGEPAEHVVTLEGELLPWVSMADALGWGFDEQPSPTVSGGGGRDNGIGVFAGQAQRERLREVVARPAPTVTGGGTAAGGVEVFASKHSRAAAQAAMGADRPVRVTLAEALTLQGFRPDYPVQGNQGQRFQQVGNAVPPPLAAAVLRAVGAVRQEVAA